MDSLRNFNATCPSCDRATQVSIDSLGNNIDCSCGVTFAAEPDVNTSASMADDSAVGWESAVEEGDSGSSSGFMSTVTGAFVTSCILTIGLTFVSVLVALAFDLNNYDNLTDAKTWLPVIAAAAMALGGWGLGYLHFDRSPGVLVSLLIAAWLLIHFLFLEVVARHLRIVLQIEMDFVVLFVESMLMILVVYVAVLWGRSRRLRKGGGQSEE